MINKFEREILDIINELRPFEHVTIIKDRNGKADAYIVHREQKVMIGIDKEKEDW